MNWSRFMSADNGFQFQDFVIGCCGTTGAIVLSLALAGPSFQRLIPFKS